MSGQNLELALKLKIAQSGLENIQNLIAELKSAGIATDGLESDAAQLAAELNSVDGATKQAAASTEKSTQAYSGAAKGVRSISEQLAEARTALLAYIGAQSAIGAAGNLINLADEYKSLEARIKLAIGEQGNLKTAMDAVSQTALTTGQNLNTVGELYASLGRSTQASQEQIAALTDVIAKSVALSGGSAASADAAIAQLNQSLASGVFRGDEFNSVMEQAPIIGDALAKSLGVTRGELRDMAADGKLTADVVTKALLDQKAAIDESFSKLPLTISRATENVKTNFALMVGELDKTSGASATVAAAINGIADNLEAISRIAVEAGAILATAFAVKAVPAIIDFSKELVVATRNAGSLRAVSAAMPTNLKITLAVAGLTAAIEGARKLGESLASMGPAAEAAAAAQAKAREQIQSVLNRQIDLIQANEKYKDTTILSTQEVAKLSDEERARYQASIEGAKRYNAALATAGFAQKELGIDVVKGSEDAAKALGGLRTALADIEAVSKLSKEAIDQMLTPNASVLIKQFDDVLSKTKDVKKALEGLTKAADFTSLTGMQGFGEALQKLGEDAKLSADQIKKAWTDALSTLSGDQLAAFAINAKAAFNSGERDAAALAEALKAQVSVAAQRAGVDIEQALGKITPATQTALGNINALQQGLQAAGYTAKDQGAIISAALENAFSSAKTNADVDAIKTRIEALGAQGLLTGGQIAQGAQLAEQALNRINGAAASAQQAIAGIKAPSDIGPALDAIQESFDKGQTSVGEYNRQIGKVLDKSRQMDEANKKTAKSTKDVGEAAQDTAKSTDDMAQAASEAGGIAEVVARKIGAALASIGALSKAAQAAAEAIRPASNDWRDWAAAVGAMDPKQFISQDQALSGLNEQLKSFRAQAKAAREQVKYLKEQAMFGPGIEWNQLSEGLANIYSFTVKLADAKARVAEFQIALYGISSAAKDGSDSLEVQARKLNALKFQYRDLDKASLRQLQDQLDQVNAKLKSMQDQADQTLQSLQEELAQQQGNFTAAAEIEGSQKLQRLQEQLNAAKAAGNAAAVTKLNEALQIQRKLNEAALAEAKTRERQAKADNSAAKTPSRAADTSTSTSASDRGAGASTPAAPVTVNIAGVLDVNDPVTLDRLSRKLQPVFADLARREIDHAED
ncbi:MAG: tape measure protein, partial [Halothiobacillus sp.]|nr:tape measure protein [Halothiobacillus sp.]